MMQVPSELALTQRRSSFVTRIEFTEPLCSFIVSMSRVTNVLPYNTRERALDFWAMQASTSV